MKRSWAESAIFSIFTIQYWVVHMENFVCSSTFLPVRIVSSVGLVAPTSPCCESNISFCYWIVPVQAIDNNERYRLVVRARL